MFGGDLLRTSVIMRNKVTVETHELKAQIMTPFLEDCVSCRKRNR